MPTLPAALVCSLFAAPSIDAEPALPRSLTPRESALIEREPIVAEGLPAFMLRGAANEPVGRVVCPPSTCRWRGS